MSVKRDRTLADLIVTTGIEKAEVMARCIERLPAGDLSKTSSDEPAAHGTGSRSQGATFRNALQTAQGICYPATQALQTWPPFNCFRIWNLYSPDSEAGSICRICQLLPTCTGFDDALVASNKARWHLQRMFASRIVRGDYLTRAGEASGVHSRGRGPDVAETTGASRRSFDRSGSQSILDFVGCAKTLGYTVTEFTPFRVGQQRRGRQLDTQNWAFNWQIDSALNTDTYARTVISDVGEPLGSWGDAVLQCEIKPAQTHWAWAIYKLALSKVDLTQTSRAWSIVPAP